MTSPASKLSCLGRSCFKHHNLAVLLGKLRNRHGKVPICLGKHNQNSVDFPAGYVGCGFFKWNISRVNVSTLGDVMSLVTRSFLLAPLRISDSLQTRCGDATECDLNKKLASSTRDD